MVDPVQSSSDSVEINFYLSLAQTEKKFSNKLSKKRTKIGFFHFFQPFDLQSVIMVVEARMSLSIAYFFLWGKEIVIASEKLNRRK